MKSETEPQIGQNETESKKRRIARKMKLILGEAAIIGSIVAGGELGTPRAIAEEHKDVGRVGAKNLEKEKAGIDELLKQPKYHVLIKRFGKKIVEESLLDGMKASEKKRANRGEEEPEVSVGAIASKDGQVSQSQVRDALANLPRNWVSGKIESINYWEGVEGHADYMPKGMNTLASVKRDDQTGESVIGFYDTAKDQPIEYILLTIDHEACHANDWRRNPSLSPEERLEMLLRVSNRSSSFSRYKSNYVESIEEKDKKLAEYDRTTEYWAVVCSKYFNDPKNLDSRDFALAEQYVKMVDPAYDPFKSAEFNRGLAEAVRRAQKQMTAKNK